MSKIAQPLIEIADIIKANGLECTQRLSPSNTIVKRFIHLAKKVPDTRMQGMIYYPLKEILLIAFFAVMSGAETWTQMEHFGKARQKWLRRFLKYKNGVPSHDTFRRVFALISPSILQQLTIDFLIDNLKRIKATLGIENKGVTLLNIDGKQSRGTGRSRGKVGSFPNLQALNIYDASNGICISMTDIDQKSNEIPAAQAALNLLDLKGALLTCDALNTQKETIRIIAGKDKKGDYVAALKKNHHLFFEEVNLFFNELTMRDIRKAGTHFFTCIDKAHSKIERRNYYLTDNVKWFSQSKDWEKLRAFVCAETVMTDTTSGEITRERRLFISSVTDVELCAEAIRGHWSVENVLHWHLDVSFGDDDDMTTDKNAFMNFSMFRRMVLSLCRLAQPFMKRSIKNIRWGIGLDYQSQLGLILGTLDEKHIESALRSANEKKA